MKRKCGYCHKNPVSDEEVAKTLGLCEQCSKTLAMISKNEKARVKYEYSANDIKES